MPVTKSAQKALKQQHRRTKENRRTKQIYKKAIKECQENPTPATLAKAYSKIALAAKKNVIHANKAARLKKKLAKLTPPAQKSSWTSRGAKKIISPLLWLWQRV